MEGKMTI